MASLIEPLYRPLSPSPQSGAEVAVDALGSYEELLTRLVPWLRLLGARLCDDVLLFSKVCRVLAELLRRYPIPKPADKSEPNPKSEEVHVGVTRLMGACVLPALSLLGPNPHASFEAWAVLALLSALRFACRLCVPDPLCSV